MNLDYSELKPEANQYYRTFVVLDPSHAFSGKGKAILSIKSSEGFPLLFEPENMVRLESSNFWEPKENFVEFFPYIYSKQEDPFASTRWISHLPQHTEKITRQIDSREWKRSLSYSEEERTKMVSELLKNFETEPTKENVTLLSNLFETVVSSYESTYGIRLPPDQKKMLINLVLRMSYDKIHV